MLIEDYPTKQVPNLYIVRYIPGIVIAASTLILPVLLLTLPQQKPTGSLLSPLPKGEIAENSTPPPAAFPYAASLNLGQNYLNKAFELAQNPAQTEADKKEIIANLNLSLKQADSLIQLDPSNPKGYLFRAQIFTAISKINPQALAYAKQDLEIASRLSQNQEFSLPPAVNPIQLLPDEQAALAQNLVVAAPSENLSPQDQTTSTDTNAGQNRVTLPAGQTELTVSNPAIRDDSYIYLVLASDTKGAIANPHLSVYVKSKSSGSFILAALHPPATDQTIDYYLINN